MRITVATRGSKLSLIQTEIALKYMKSVLPQLEFVIKPIKTLGDVRQNEYIHEIGVIGVFEKDVDKAVLSGEADIAVHSLKDLPSKIPEELEIVFTPPRDSPHDVLIHRSGCVVEPHELPPGTIVGTSSIRRKMQILFVNNNVEVKLLRGNVDTRIMKLMRGDYDAIIVAECGVTRLGLNIKYYRLPLIPFTPPPGQGVIAVVALADSWIAKTLKGLSDPLTTAIVKCERAFIENLGEGCKTPIGFICLPRQGKVQAIANVFIDNGVGIWIKREKDIGMAEKLGLEMADEVKSYLR